MKIQILCFGNTPRPEEKAWIDRYMKRASSYSPVSLTRIKESDWKRFEEKIPEKTFRVFLDSKGKMLDTEGFASLVQKAIQSGRGSMTFLVGGAYGLPREALDTADAKISLSALTLPHRLALLILVEQIYRVLSWRAGAPYHHA